MNNPYIRHATGMSLLTALLATCLIAAPVEPAPISQVQARTEDSIVRGRVERQRRTNTYPVAQVRVTLASTAAPQRRITTYTDSGGMYYFSVPRGDYVLEIWGPGQAPLVTASIRVNQRYVNIAPLQIR